MQACDVLSEGAFTTRFCHFQPSKNAVYNIHEGTNHSDVDMNSFRANGNLKFRPGYQRYICRSKGNH